MWHVSEQAKCKVFRWGADAEGTKGWRDMGVGQMRVLRNDKTSLSRVVFSNNFGRTLINAK